MLRINCPWCGTRDEEEFNYGGPWDKARPADPASLTDEQWAAYLFGRDNPCGPAWERWRHTHGCRQWFVVQRHTVTHTVLRVARMDQVPRQPGGTETAAAAAAKDAA
jgi:sarcosine oxidase subunit delta